MSINLREGIYRIVNVAAWIWILIFLLVSYLIINDNGFSIKLVLFLVFLTFGIPIIIKQIIKYILSGF